MKEDLEEKISPLGVAGMFVGLASTTYLAIGVEPIRDYLSSLEMEPFFSLYLGVGLLSSISLAFLGDYINKRYVKKK